MKRIAEWKPWRILWYLSYLYGALGQIAVGGWQLESVNLKQKSAAKCCVTVCQINDNAVWSVERGVWSVERGTGMELPLHDDKRFAKFCHGRKLCAPETKNDPKNLVWIFLCAKKKKNEKIVVNNIIIFLGEIASDMIRCAQLQIEKQISLCTRDATCSNCCKSNKSRRHTNPIGIHKLNWSALYPIVVCHGPWPMGICRAVLPAVELRNKLDLWWK